jgi:branched-chain amino acid transport system substrate-binding protein
MGTNVNRRSSRQNHRTVRRWLCVILVLGVLTAACGSRRSAGDLLAAARGGRAASSGIGAGDQSGAGGDSTTGSAAAGSQAGNAAIGGGSSGAGSAGGSASGGSGGGPGGGPGGSGAQAGAKSPVSIGALGDFSGVGGQLQQPDLAGLRAWIKSVNDRGGLNGHPVNNLIVADDGGDAARNRQLAQQLIEQNHVVALIFDGALDGSGTVSYVTQQGVPFVGGVGTGDYFYQSPVYFPQAPQGNDLAESTQGALPVLGRQGKTKVAVIACAESNVCSKTATALQRVAPRYGAQVVYSTTSSITQPDFSSECLNARNAGAQVVYAVTDGASVGRIAQSCSRQNFHPQYVTTAAALTPDMAQNGDLQGLMVPSVVLPIASNSSALQEFRAAMAKYASGQQLVDGQVVAWTAGKVLELGAKGLPDGDVPTLRKALLNGLWNLHGFDPGLSAPEQYNPNAPASRTVCWFMEQVQNNRFVSDGNRSCVPYDPSLAS